MHDDRDPQDRPPEGHAPDEPGSEPGLRPGPEAPSGEPAPEPGLRPGPPSAEPPVSEEPGLQPGPEGQPGRTPPAAGDEQPTEPPPPEGVAPTASDQPPAAGDPAADAPAEPDTASRRIWDPDAGRWVEPDEIATAEPAAAQPPAVTADRTPPEGIPAVPPAGRATAPPAAPAWLTGLVGAAIGAAVIAAIVFFFPGFVERGDDGPATVVAGDGGGLEASSLVDALRPSIVSITVARPEAPDAAETRRSGSGLILTDDGVIATSALLLEGAETIVATLANGQAVQAQLVGIDPVTDVGVIRITGTELPEILRASAEFVRLGEPVAVVASPAETFAAVTTGVVSQIGRPVRPEGGDLKLDLIQIDATGDVTPGAVVAGVDGSAIAMTTSIRDRGGAKYALPIDLVWGVAGSLVTGVEVVHPWTGAVVSEAPGLPNVPEGTTALVIAVVFRDSPAAEAGLVPGEMIIRINGEDVDGVMSLMARVNEAGPGAEIRLTVQDREGNRREVNVGVRNRPPDL